MARPTLASRYRLTVGAVLALALLWASSATLAGAQAGTPACPPAPSSGASEPSGASAPALGSAVPGSEQVLACVGAEAITGATYVHWATIANDAATQPGHKHGELPSSVAAEQVMAFLISSDWIIGEARERGIVFSEATVRKQFDHIRHAQFPHPKEFKKFLESSGQTVADLLFRVRLNLMSEQIQKQVLAGHHGKRAQRQALANFVGEFKSRWMGQTYCEPAFAVSDCGHTQALQPVPGN
jgi:hypothetical protein